MMAREGDAILRLTKEFYGYGFYYNEARKVDTELVKDWAAILLFCASLLAVTHGCYLTSTPGTIVATFQLRLLLTERSSLNT
jgi:hypothetical protein